MNPFIDSSRKGLSPVYVDIEAGLDSILTEIFCNVILSFNRDSDISAANCHKKPLYARNDSPRAQSFFGEGR